MILPYGKNQIGELLKEEKHVIGGLMAFITARINMEISINYMWHGKDKMDDNGLKAVKYIQRVGASHTGECDPVFF